MTKNTFFKLGVFLFVIASVVSWSNADKLPKQETPKEAGFTNWYSVKQIAEGVWLINDNNVDNMYLVEGTDSAILIDTGIGAARLDKVVDSLTSKPLIVVNTHGHPDHVGGNFLFDKVYAHPADFESIHFFYTKEGRTFKDGSIPAGTVISEKYALDTTIQVEPSKLLAVKEGHVFDLGGRKLEVIETPGHTPGGICLIDKANKIIFTGDTNNAVCWLFLPGCLPLELYKETLVKQKKLGHLFDTMYLGHGEPLDKAFIDEQITCVDLILKGKCKPTKSETFMGPQDMCTYKRAGIVYDANNLFVKK